MTKISSWRLSDFIVVICGIRVVVFESFLQRVDMAVRIGRGAGRRRPVANAEVLEILQRFEARVDVVERRRPEILETLANLKQRKRKKMLRFLLT